MFGYLEKFKKLPKDLQAVVSGKEATVVIDELEKTYGIDLDVEVIKIMVKETPWQGISLYFQNEHHLGKEKTTELLKALETKLFHNVTRYLGITKVKPDQGNMQPKSKPVASQSSEVKSVSIEQLQKISGFDTSNADLVNRFKKIIDIFHKEVRDAIATGETLGKKVESGGMGLPKDKVDAVVASLRSIKPDNIIVTIGKKPALGSFENKESLDKVDKLRDVEYDFGEAAKAKVPAASDFKPKQATSPVPEQKQDTSHQLAPPPPAISQPATKPKTIKPSKEPVFQVNMDDMKNVSAQQKITPPKSTTKQPPVAMTTPKPIAARPVSTDKRQMNDITKPVSRLQGPIEEISSLDLVKFNRLASTTSGITNKIKQKIDLLEQESLTKRQQGVNAWKQSPVHKMYVSLGQESMMSGKPLEEVITTKEKQGEKIISLDQFKAILDLNQQLQM